VTVVDGVPEHLPAIRRLHDVVQARADVFRPWADHDWEAWLPNVWASGHRLLVALRDGEPVGFGTLVYYEEFGFDLAGPVAADADAADALIDACRIAAGEARLVIEDRPGDPFGDRVRARGVHVPWFSARYIKVPDPWALLDALRPVLDRRLASSALAAQSGVLPISSFASTIEVHYADGRITDLRRAPGLQDPSEEGGIGVPPDWFGALVLGRFSPAELEARVDDVMFDGHRDLVEVLFPPLLVDVDWML
jgi:hypothetical protein